MQYNMEKIKCANLLVRFQSFLVLHLFFDFHIVDNIASIQKKLIV